MIGNRTLPQLLFAAIFASLPTNASADSAQTPAPTPVPSSTSFSAPCEDAARGVAAVVADPSVPIVAAYPQGFVIVLYAISSAGYGWRQRPDPAAATFAQLTDTVNISDLDGHLSDLSGKLLVGGGSTQYFLFRVERDQLAIAQHRPPSPSPSTNTLTFDKFAPGNPTPIESRTFSVRIVPNYLVC